MVVVNNTHNQGTWILSNSTGLNHRFDSDSIMSPIEPNKWYQLELNVTNKEISASIDGTIVSHIPLFNSSNGWVAIGSSWNHVQFDYLTIGESLAAKNDF